MRLPTMHSPVLLAALLLCEGAAPMTPAVAENSHDGVPHNQREGLLPPAGSGWRGVVGSNGSASQYHASFGEQLHVLRIFAKHGITDEIRQFVRAGGILWYNWKSMNWKGVASGQQDKGTIADLANDVLSFAPAKVMVCLTHEPDHDVDPSAGRSTADYRNMWAHVQDIFKQRGVQNVIWVMDYSVGITDRSKGGFQWQNALDMWPGDGRVDWLFFNIFERGSDPESGENYVSMVTDSYNKFSTAADSKCAATCGFTKIPWGLGAFGTHTSAKSPKAKPGTRKGPVLFKDQVRFLTDAKAQIPNLPRLRAYIYFDALSSTMTSELKPYFKTFLHDNFFTQNDATASATANSSSVLLI